MMTNTGGFQSIYPPNTYVQNSNGYNNGAGNYGYNHNNFHRSNTYIPPNTYQNPNYPYQQPYIPPTVPLQHSNTYMPPQPQMNPQPLPPPTIYTPPQNPYPSQPAFHRSNTYMPPPPSINQNPSLNHNPPSALYQNPSAPFQNPSDPYQNHPNPQMYPPQPSPYMVPYRSNTYRPPRPSSIGIPPISSTNFNPEQDCQVLRNAVHGIGTDEKAIINIIINRNAAQRAEIRNYYKSCYGKDLIKRLKEDTSGNFKQVIAGMFMTPAE